MRSTQTSDVKPIQCGSREARGRRALLEQQQLLFGQCMLEEDGSSIKCSELQVSIAALQEALGVGGRVVSTAGLK